jgi:glyoxylase-like metal-dependent hydrolase (beta-lactamase superfamily II)
MYRCCELVHPYQSNCFPVENGRAIIYNRFCSKSKVREGMKMQFSSHALIGEIQTLDLQFMGLSGTIAAYLIIHPHGAVLIESGPGSTIPALTSELDRFGLSPSDISDVLVTHIHLDHAGAAGWLASQGARIHVHPVGAPHLLNPEKLLNSAARIYGEMMDTLWGEFLAVPEDKLVIIPPGETVEIEGLAIQALDTPGHAEHHYVYLYRDVCFSGDIGGVRLSGCRHLRVPMPPPEFHLEKWRDSLQILEQAKFSQIAPTHFGLFSDPDWHLGALKKGLDEAEAWMQAVMPFDPPLETLTAQFMDWARDRSLAEGLDPEMLGPYEAANPSWMSSSGIQRYWRKFRQAK